MQLAAALAKHLLLTDIGEDWLRNFAEGDRPAARELVAALSLVSHNEFERGLNRLVVGLAQEVTGAVALYGARELPNGLNLEPTAPASVDATPRGGDIGSEGRVASLIRGICRSRPRKLLNHPTLNELRQQRVDVVLVLDDFIGSGERCTEYLNAVWEYPSVKSWVSYKAMRFVVAAYAGASDGIRRVQRHPAHPSVEVVRHCPTVKGLIWEQSRIDRVHNLCHRYAKVKKLYGPPLGYQDTGALLVFEHGCPNNAPAVLWAASKNDAEWQPLFSARSVEASMLSAFPPEIARRDPVHSLVEAGQKRMAGSMRHVIERPLPADIIVALTLIWRGRRRKESIADATGLTAREVENLLERCIAAGLISPLHRITGIGEKEIRGIRASTASSATARVALGSDEYHPTALRSRIGG